MQHPIRAIVVGVALVDELDPVLPSAIRLAESVGADLHVAHVLDVPEPLHAGGGTGALPASRAHYLGGRAQAVEEALKDQCARLAGSARGVVVRALTGSAHRELAEYASEVGADVLVIGATRHGRLWRSILGTTAERVLRLSRVPVLVLHQPFFRPVERVLLTTDLSALSVGVHESGLDMVQSLFPDARLEARSLLVLPGQLPPPLTAELEQVARAEHGEFLGSRRRRAFQVLPRLRTGDAPVEINVEADAWGADLIVLGTHGRSGLARYAFGSVAAATLRDAVRNVLVIPALASPEVGHPAHRSSSDRVALEDVPRPVPAAVG